jgi:murein DD-endopeptidase MepM/ murein hydrolase activator NlpD
MNRPHLSLWQRFAWGLLALLGAPALAAEMASVPLADGFEVPVGRDGTKSYYKARGFRQNGHLGEDWNGTGGGDTDLGDPVYSTAHGIVVFARDYRLGWGNVVIVRHAYFEGGEVKFVDSLYGHLDRMDVAMNQFVRRGQQVGTIGNNRGMYDAHLHFEMRKNITIGMHRSSFARDFTNYWDPSEFIAARTTLPAGRAAAVPINTFPTTPPPALPAPAIDPLLPPPSALPPKSTKSSPRGPFRVDRFGDMRGQE